MNKENISSNIPQCQHHEQTSHTCKHKHSNYDLSKETEDLKHLSLSEIKARHHLQVCDSCRDCKECQTSTNTKNCHMTIPMDCIGQVEGIESFSKGLQVVFRDLKGLCHVFSITMAIKLNIFEIIQMYNSNTFMCMKEIRSLLKGTNITERNLRDLMMVLTSQGFLEMSGEFGSEKFRNTEITMSNFISSSSSNVCKSYLNMERFMNLFSDYSKEGFSHLHTLNHSNSPYVKDEDAEGDLDYYYKVTERSFNKMTEIVDFSKFSKVTDIRGGCGKYAMEIKEKNPNCEVRSFDKPSIEKFALKAIDSKGKSKDVSVLSGDLVSDTLPESDCVIAPHIFMHFSNDTLKQVLKNVCSCIKQNGQLVIMESLLHGDKSDSTTFAMSFMMQVLNCEGFARTFDELKACLMDAGFKSVERKEMGVGMCDLLVCQK